ncbi:guanine nucleotide-exchange factor SEC12-like [Styela clava]
MSGLCRLDYPIYACSVLDDNHIVVAGGGGAAKTGVPNAVDILKIEKIGRVVQADPVERLETGDTASMNISVLNQGKDAMLAVGLGGKCSVYSVVKKSAAGGDNTTTNLKQRKSKKKSQPVGPDENKQEHYTFNLLRTLETDFSSDPLQKAVRISKDGKLLVTGGSDGYVRCWSLPDFTKRFSTHGHKDDVTDVDISPDGLHVVSVARDGGASIWNSVNGNKEIDLHSAWNLKMVTRGYRFRCCRYASVIEDKTSYVLFTAHAPVRAGRGADKKAPQGCLTKWARKRANGTENSKNSVLSPVIIQFTGKEAISSLAVSNDGVFLGLGFMEGSVAIYISFSLQCVKKISSLHGIFVTGVSFLPNTEAVVAITGACDASLVSVSADNTCKLTKLSSRYLFPLWVAIFLSFIALVLTGLFMREYGII